MTIPLTAVKERDRRVRGSEFERPRTSRTPAVQAAREASPTRALWLFATAVLWLLAVLALATHNAADPGFTTSGRHELATNAVGRVGAWASDLALFLLGYSVWWIPLIVARHWLSVLAGRLRGLHVQDDVAAAWPGSGAAIALRVAGVVMLLTASAALEWTRLYHAEPGMPGHAGGVLGWSWVPGR